MSNKYKLGDITQAQMTNDWSRVPRAAAIGAFLVTGGATTSLAVATAIVGGGWITAAAIYAVGFIATTLVTSFLTKALAPKSASRGSNPKSASDSGGLLVNARGAANPAQVVYGRIRKGGTVTYVEATGTDNKILHQIVVLAAHEVEEIGDIYFDDQIVYFDDENVESAPFNGHVKVYKHLGNQTSATDAFANSTESLDTTLHNETGVGPNFIGKGISYLYCRFEYDQDAFVNGLPTVTAIVNGKKVVSTINGVAQTAAYSNNAAWVIRDFLTSSYGLNDDQIDYATFEAAADVCDDDPDNRDKFKYTIDGVIDLDQPIGDVLSDMMTACAGSLFWGGGKWKLIAGEWIEPTKTLTLDDFRSPINLKTKASTRDNFNKVAGTFIDESNDYVSADYPVVSGSGGFLSEDNNVETTLDFPLPLTTNYVRAQRLAKQALFRGREQMTLNADFSLDAMDLEVGDVVNLINERYGWGEGTEKSFEVLGWRLNANADTGALHVNLDLKETSEASFGFTEADEQTIISNNTTLLRYYEVPTVSVSLNTEYRVVNENVVNVLLINITSTQMERVDSVNVKYKKSTDTNYKSIAQSVLLDEGNDAGRFEVVGIEVPNASDAVSTITYDVVVTPINSFGYKGAPVEVSINVGPDVTAPECNEWYTGELTHQTSGGGIYFKWPAVSDLDLSHYRLYHNPSTSANFADGNTEVLVEKIARPATSVSIPATAGKFFLSAVDKTGNNSTSNVEIGTVTRLLSDTVDRSELPPLDFTLTWPEATSFSGAKSNVTVSSGEIFLTTVTVGSDTYYTTQGTYQFYHDEDFNDQVVEGYFDVGGVRTIRTSFDVTTSRRHINSVAGEVTWDEIPNNWDTWPDNFEDWTDETTQFGDTVVTIQVRAASTTGGLSSATWVDAGGEVVGRYVQFRAKLDTTNALASPEITALSATVEY
jgi:hypothetical protein